MKSCTNLLFLFLLFSPVTLPSVITPLQAQLSRPEAPDTREIKDFITIYTDFTEENLGRSPYREAFYSIALESFQRYRSYPSPEGGWLTSVVVSAETEEKLYKRELPLSNYIRQQDEKYSLSYQGINITFSLQRPTQRILKNIERTYANLPETKKLILNHYHRNFVVRIHEAENVLQPGDQKIDYVEALLSATIIGDREQWLWGIHDARNLLNEP